MASTVSESATSSAYDNEARGRTLKLDDPPDDAATPDEVRAAIEGLSKEDTARLKKAATYCLYGTEFQNPLELINEAVVRTLNAAHGDKGRTWRRSVPFMAYMINTVKGIANDSQESLPQTRTVHMEAMATPATSAEDALGALGHCNTDVVEQALEVEETAERRDRAKADADAIDAHFTGDDEITWVIMGLKDGQSATDIREMSGMSGTQYETARKRFRRGLEKLFPGRRKT